MTAELRPVTPGTPQTIAAADWNAHNDAAKAFLRSEALGLADGVNGWRARRDPVIVSVILDVAVDQFDVVALDSSAVQPTSVEVTNDDPIAQKWRAKTLPRASAMTWAKVPRFGVVLIPGKVGDTSQVVVSGAVPCFVNVPAAPASWAPILRCRPEDGSTALVAHPAGNCEILWKDAGTGLVPALVQIASGRVDAFNVVLRNPAGLAGDETQNSTLVYDLHDLESDTLVAVGVSPHRSRFPLTEYTAAPAGSYGSALVNPADGTIVLLEALQEIEASEVCT